MVQCIKRCLLIIAAVTLFAQVVPARAIPESTLESVMNGRPNYDRTAEQCATSGTPTPARIATPGPVFVLGDSIGEGITPTLQGALPASGGWGVSGDSAIGRKVSEAITIVKSAAPEGLKTAKHILIVLGTNPDSKNNAAGISELIAEIKKVNSPATIYWVKVNVTNPDYTANAEAVNSVVASLNGITPIDNTVELKNDGTHPKDIGAFGTYVATQITTGASTTPVTTTGSTTPEENKQIIFQYFLANGYNAIQAAGIMGNMSHESGFEPQRQQSILTRKVSAEEFKASGSGSGWGLVQWTPGSKMIDPVKQAGKDPNNLVVQLDFLRDQLAGLTPIPETRPAELLKSATTIEAAVRAFARYERFNGYENDNNPEYTERIANAQEYYDSFNGLAPAGLAAAAASCGNEVVSSGPMPEGTVTLEQTTEIPGSTARIYTPLLPKFMEMLTAAKNSSPSIDLLPISSGWRSAESQIALRKKNCGTSHYAIYEMSASSCSPPTAKPGKSNHEGGVAIDFGNMCYPRATCPGNPRWEWLMQNAGTYGFKKLPAEAWHWSPTGG